MTKTHIVTGGIDASSSRSTSKQLRLQHNLFRHQHQQNQNQETVLVRSLMWQANRQPRMQHQSHRGVRCQVRGQEQERGFARRSFNLKQERRNERLGKSVVQGTIQRIETLRERRKRHFEKEKVLKDILK